ncbi:MAG: hypothetical protein ACI4JF_03425 [Oscillospiraceae bacterium]
MGINIHYVYNGVRRSIVFIDVEVYNKSVVVDSDSTSILYTCGDKQFSFFIRYGCDYISATLFSLSSLMSDAFSDNIYLDVEYEDIEKFFNVLDK